MCLWIQMGKKSIGPKEDWASERRKKKFIKTNQMKSKFVWNVCEPKNFNEKDVQKNLLKFD